MLQRSSATERFMWTVLDSPPKTIHSNDTNHTENTMRKNKKAKKTKKPSEAQTWEFYCLKILGRELSIIAWMRIFLLANIL